MVSYISRLKNVISTRIAESGIFDSAFIQLELQENYRNYKYQMIYNMRHIIWGMNILPESVFRPITCMICMKYMSTLDAANC